MGEEAFEPLSAVKETNAIVVNMFLIMAQVHRICNGKNKDLAFQKTKTVWSTRSILPHIWEYVILTAPISPISLFLP